MGNWKEFPKAVGAIDTTPHEIYWPLTEPQRPFYSGYRHYYCMNSQLVMDNEGHAYPLCSGWIPILASTHDAVSFRQMEPIGPGRNLDLPPLELRFNTLLSKTRVKIENVFKEVKTYKAIGQIWRHPRWLMPVYVELVALLSERGARLFKPACKIRRKVTSTFFHKCAHILFQYVLNFL